MVLGAAMLGDALLGCIMFPHRDRCGLDSLLPALSYHLWVAV
jgi:hypothetical protein